MRRGVFVVMFLLTVSLVFGETGYVADTATADTATADTAAAVQYAAYVKTLIDEGKLDTAAEVMRRASDFFEVSSTLSLLAAELGMQRGDARISILAHAERALVVDRWADENRVSGADSAHFIAARCLCDMRLYSASLSELDAASSEGDPLLRLEVYARMGESMAASFRAEARSALAWSASSPEWRALTAAIVFRRADNLATFLSAYPSHYPSPDDDDERLVVRETLRAVTPLFATHRGLLPLAAPLMSEDDAARYLASYAATGDVPPEHAALLLEHGVFDENAALAAVWKPETKDARLPFAALDAVYHLLRTDEARAAFRASFESYSGIITRDTDGDTVDDTFSTYEAGHLSSFDTDLDQDGYYDVAVAFGPVLPASAAVNCGDKSARVSWAAYPEVESVALAGVTWYFAPAALYYNPLRVFYGYESQKTMIAEYDGESGLNENSLRASAEYLDREDAEFVVNGKPLIETVAFHDGVPLSASVYNGTNLVKSTKFRGGAPIEQKVDLDLDGRLETVRFFRQNEGRGGNPLDYGGADCAFTVAKTMSDLDDDGVYEHVETFD